MKHYLLITGLTILLSSCFKDTNIDPTRAADAEVYQILPGLEAQTARNLGSIGARVTGTVVQHFVGLNNQPDGYTNYVIDEVTLNDFWRTGLYGGAMKDCADIINKAKTKNIPYYEGIAKLLMAVNLALATSCWGEVPYTEALLGEGNLTPAYDAQETVYNSIQSLLDQSILDFGKPAGELNPGSDDIIFKGNTGKWLAVARALKARYFIHTSKREANAAANALTALAAGSITSNGNQPNFPFGSSNNEANPIASFAVQRPGQLAVGKFLSDLLVNKTDPRLGKYTQKVGSNYIIYSATNTSLYWAQNNSPLPLISFTETKFISAEAYLRTNDEVNAELELAAAIKASMEEVGLTSTDYAAYMAAYGNFTGLTTFEEKLARIIEEKYIALYAQGTFEAWVDYRRTGYPLLVPPANAQTSFNPGKVIPQRYLYPISERTANTDNVTAAIDRQGGHLMDVPFWAFK